MKLATLRAWRHAGEEEATVIFSKRVGRTLLMYAIVLTACWFVFSRPYPVAFAVVTMMLGLRTIAERRRAIIFSSSELIYRPAFGTPLRIPLREITDVKITAILQSLYLRPGWLPGIELTLSSGEMRKVPLDFGETDQIMERLRVWVNGQLRFK